jgi:hypothetical protein
MSALNHLAQRTFPDVGCGQGAQTRVARALLGWSNSKRKLKELSAIRCIDDILGPQFRTDEKAASFDEYIRVLE